MPLVFAYGSNLLRARIAERVPGVVIRGRAYLPGRRLCFRKRSRDGSGKADLQPTGRPEDRVWGVLHAMSEDERRGLDAHEPGYALEDLVVYREDHTQVRAVTYLAEPAHHDGDLVPFNWYLALVVHGAREQGLPPDYTRVIEAMRSQPDPDAGRAQRHRALL